MKKVNNVLNIIIGSFVGVFIGHGLYVLWNFKTRPELYAMQSAPWYTSLNPTLLAICVVQIGAIQNI